MERSEREHQNIMMFHSTLPNFLTIKNTEHRFLLHRKMPSLVLSYDMIKIMLAFRDCERERLVKEKIMLAFRDCERERLVKEQKQLIPSGILVTGEEYLRDILKITHAFACCTEDREKRFLMETPQSRLSQEPSFMLKQSPVKGIMQSNKPSSSQKCMVKNDVISSTMSSASNVNQRCKRSLSSISDDDDDGGGAQAAASDIKRHAFKVKSRKKHCKQEQEDARLLLSLSSGLHFNIS